MKRISLVIFILILFSNCFGQTNNVFEINEVFVTDSSQLKSPLNFKKKDSVFYQDNKYIVRATCHGEWGGSVWFKNKKTGKEHSCRATCPTIVNKIGSKYYVTANLYHMNAGARVIEIKDPELMTVYDTIAVKKRKWRSGYDTEETDSYKGIKYLADTAGTYIITSFTNQDSLYHLLSGFYAGDKIYISTIRQNKFITIDTIPGGSIMRFTKAFLTTDNHYLMFFSNGCKQGYIDIFGNKITILRYDKLLELNKNCH